MKVSDIPIYYPPAMTSLPNWILWKLEESVATGKLTKVPYSALYTGHASSTNPNTWTTFERVMNVYQNTDEYSGIGFVFNLDSGIVFVDIDHCINENGILNETATDILEMIDKDTFVEVSQSGTGLHIFAKGGIPKAFKHNSVEMYSEKRFVAMTGRAIIQKDVTDLSKELLRIHAKYKTPEPKREEKKPCTHIPLSLNDSKIIEKASQNTEDFQRLYDGDISGFESHSNADMRMCMILAFWSDCNAETIDRIFRTSGLCREKWTEREDYREATIKYACDNVRDTYSHFVERKKEEEKENENRLNREYARYILHRRGDTGEGEGAKSE